MTEEQVKQLRLNTRNIDALVQTMEAQGKEIVTLQAQIQIQANSIITLNNDLGLTRKAMSDAASTMGHGPTVR